MKIAFTICSNNYLAQAKTFTESLLSENQDITVFIFLIDKKKSEIDYKYFAPAEVIEVNDSVFGQFNELITKYNIVELNTAVKPFLFEYLSKRFSDCNRLYYFDPDIFIYHNLGLLDQLLNDNDILLTPHFLTPVPIDGLEPFENLALNYGTFNLGFLAINPETKNAKAFLKWWGQRTFRFGYSRVDQGFFVDQLWFNLVPIFFERVFLIRHPGYNMAPWNLHERSIKLYKDGDGIILESDYPLVFYHFSSYDFSKPDLLSTKYTRYSFKQNPSLRKLHRDYAEKIILNKHTFFKQFRCELPIRISKEPALRVLFYKAVNFLKKVRKKN